MQEIILENLVKWFSNLNFSLNKQDNKLSLTCKELNIKIENLSREEFITEVTEQGINGVEKLFNLKVLGIDLRELFGIKKVKKEEENTEKKAKPSAKTEEKPQDLENWIKQELNRAFEEGKLTDKNRIFRKLDKNYEFFRIPRESHSPVFTDFPKFYWDNVICSAPLK